MYISLLEVRFIYKKKLLYATAKRNIFVRNHSLDGYSSESYRTDVDLDLGFSYIFVVY